MSTLRKYSPEIYLLILVAAVLGLYLYLGLIESTFYGPVAGLPMYYWILLGGLTLASFLVAIRKIRRKNSTMEATAYLIFGVVMFLLSWQLFASTGWTGATLPWAISSIGFILLGVLRLALALRQ